MLLLLASAHAADPLVAVTVPLLQAAPGATASNSVVLRNDGAAAVHVTAVEIQGDASFHAAGLAPAEVAAHQTYAVSVSWTRAGEALPTASLIVHATEGTMTIPLATGGGQPEGVVTGTGGLIVATATSEPIILGSLQKPDIDAGVKERMTAIRDCYKSALGRHPGLSGSVTIKFVIDKDGRVSVSMVKSTTLGEPTMEACVATAIQASTYPAPKGGGIVIVSYPFTFSPG